jgi:anaerobic ribonucleoside-triphosphate reductase activating protein
VPTSKKNQINIAAELKESTVNGPGKRYVIWVQGCHFKCPGCFNPDFQPFKTNKLVDVSTLARRIFSVKTIEGITYTGGEPLLQCETLVELNKLLIKKGLSIVCYTGYTLKELQMLKNPYITEFLSQVDILIDGRFQENNKANLLWRGSKNQNIHFLTNRYNGYEKIIDSGGEIEIIIGNDKITYTGMLQDEIIKRMNDMIKNHG